MSRGKDRPNLNARCASGLTLTNVSRNETFEEWRDRTKPSPESMALAAGRRLPTYLVAGLCIVWLGGFEPPQAMVLLAVLAVLYACGVIKRQWLRQGAKLDDSRIRATHWVPLAAAGCGAVFLAWGDTSELLVLASSVAVWIVDGLWHPLDRVASAWRAHQSRA
jgi:hypothetical protein